MAVTMPVAMHLAIVLGIAIMAFSAANSAKGRSLIGRSDDSAQRTTAKLRVSFQKLRLSMVILV